jgi:hypothetical protein
MPFDTWEALDAEVQRIDADAAYKPLRPLVDKLLALVGARTPDIATARLLLIAITSVRDGQVRPDDLIDVVQKTRSGFYQPGWDVNTVLQANRDVVIQVMFDAMPQLKSADAGIPVPIVPVVMTAQEAAELASGRAFDGHPDVLCADFKLLHDHLVAVGLADWQTHYRDKPEDWWPFGTGPAGRTIAEHASEALTLLNGAHESPKKLVPQFHDVRALSKARPLVQQLRSKGCIVILDAISIRHPALLAAFQRTLLDAYPGTAVLTLAPRDESFTLVRSMIYSLQLRLNESELSVRMNDPLEPFGVCQELTAMERFPGWFVTQTRQICKGALAEAGIRGHVTA